MNISKIEKASQKYVFLAAVIGLTLFAGAKHGSPTNDPPDSTSGDSSPTNDPPAAAPLVQVQSPSPRMELLPLLSSTSPSHFDSITNWTARGAWCDWKRIEFGDSFSFPCGTNLLTGVTLMSYGELRSSLHSLTANSQQLTAALAALPQAVSLEPDASSVTYGLTPSNSFVFIWENACVNRDATNRINAAIELFQNGSIAVSTTSDVQPSTYNLQPPVVPEGYYGQGQNEEWLTNTFAFAADEIAEKGYQGWLDDYVGINEPNGRYRCSVTIAALPEHGPCYLVVGPYRMVVTTPGTYDFPLIDLTEYDARTYPEAVPLSFSYDDGYQPDIPSPLMLSAPMPMLAGAPNDNVYKICRIPEVYVNPSHIPLNEAVGRHIEIFCNAANIAVRNYETVFGNISLVFGSHSDAVIEEAEVQGMVRIFFQYGGMSCSGYLEIDPPWYNPWIDPPSTNDWSDGGSTNGNSSSSN